jgi:hypothetical protein
MFAVCNWILCNMASEDSNINHILEADKKQRFCNSDNTKFIFVKSYIVNYTSL